MALAIPGVIRFSNENLDAVLQLYSTLTERTVLQHPALKRTPYSLTATNRTREQALQAVETLLRQEGIAMIPDGEKFVLVVPQAERSAARPRSLTFVPPYSMAAQAVTNFAAIPDGMVEFRDTPLWQAAYVYGAFADRNFTNSGRLPLQATINLRTANALTRSEMCYAFETLFDWHGLQVVTNVGRTFTLTPRAGVTNQPRSR